MKLIKTLVLSLSLLFVADLQAQDIHWTLFNMSPLTLNPALTGSYEGTFRIGGIYRDQYRSVMDNAYSTPSVFVDAPILMIGKRNWLGVGAVIYQDAAGIGKLTTTTYQLSAALHLALDRKGDNVVTLGFQGGQVVRKIKDLESYVTGIMISDNLGPGILSQDLINIQQTGGGDDNDPEANFFDLNAGLLLKSRISKTSSFEIGVSGRHLIKGEYNFDTQSGNNRNDDFKLGLRMIAHAKATFELTDKWTFDPTVYYTNLTPASQFQIQAWGGYNLNPEEKIKLNMGLGYRAGDAGQILAGMDYKDFRVAAGYDLTLSALNEVNNYQGGFEIAVWYIAKIFKEPEVKPIILCPHL